MKKILAILLLVSFSLSTSAQYIEGQENIVTDESIPTTMSITTTMVDEPKICTMEYAPVCAQVQVQCIMAPCYPVAETFGNSCMAGDNPIIHTGECNSYLDMALYTKYQEKESKIYGKIEKLPLISLKKGVILIDKMIEKTKLMRMVQGALEERITGLIFIKHLFVKEIDSRK